MWFVIRHLEVLCGLFIVYWENKFSLLSVQWQNIDFIHYWFVKLYLKCSLNTFYSFLLYLFSTDLLLICYWFITYLLLIHYLFVTYTFAHSPNKLSATRCLWAASSSTSVPAASDKGWSCEGPSNKVGGSSLSRHVRCAEEILQSHPHQRCW